MILQRIAENIFSVKNNGIHKVTTVLGLKFKFKSKKLLKKRNAAKDGLLKNNYSDKFKYVLPIETIKKIILNAEIVSFDIFDTLLYRPCINPTDIFYLIAKKVDKTHNIDFIKLRLNAEKLLNNNHANIHEIYNFIQEHYGIDKKIIDILKNEEINCEKQLLQVRADIKEIYDFALENKKKIILVSDMYLTSEILKDILNSKGYSNIDKIYVSNEWQARKDEGELYNVVINNEGLSPDKICHIGDNFISDYKLALKNYITAIYYPSVKDILFTDNCIYNDVFDDVISDDPITRILIGFSLNRIFQHHSKSFDTPKLFSNLSDFVNIAFAPIVFHIAMSIATNPDIQNNYDKIYFAARDGYLPKLAYDYITTKLDKRLPSEYLYASRRAYLAAVYSDLIEWFNDNVEHMQHTMKFDDMLSVIDDTNLINAIKQQLSPKELNICVKENIKETIKILEKINPLCKDYFKSKNEQIKQYYTSKINQNSTRNIIFDIGYSGSVSLALNKITNQKWDKIYLWQNDKNIARDKKYDTNTTALFTNNTYLFNFELLFEELFSPLEGSCLGFKDSNPICEKINFSNQMEADLNLTKDLCLNYIFDIFKVYGEYSKYLCPNDADALHRIIIFMITKSPYCETSIFKNIIFPDPVAFNIPITLEAKLSNQNYSTNVFNQTAFNNPKYYQLPVNCNIKTDKKLAVHLHLFNIYMLNEILYYLKDFPFDFDLIITIVDEKVKNLVSNLLNKNSIPKLNNIDILTVPNRGRDIAPWLVSTKDYQDKYDLFCHIHSKESVHFGKMGKHWREYLFENLIKKDAVKNIMSLISNNQNIGIVFPKIYTALSDICIKNHVIQEGEFGEINLIRDLSDKMGFSRTYCYNTLLFSEGTMFWYNPKALKPLFDLDLKYEDFPEEPIGVGGTIAHAIERLPVYICQEAGYDCLIYNEFNGF